MAAFAVCCMLLLTFLPGCATTQTTGSYDRALAAFQSHRYSTSHDHAVRAMRQSSGQRRDEATYLAGLSAYLLGDIDEAELRLSAASRSSEAQVAANAKAMLGQVRMDQNRNDEAVRLFREAASGLNAGDAQQAERYATLAGGGSQSATQWASASSSGFSLQVGAFQDQRRAAEAAEDAERVIAGEGLGPVRIIPTRDARGRTLYLVQFGRFDTRSAAAQARAQIGRLDYFVATTRQSLTDASTTSRR